jgi:hypothetical protein
MEEREGKKKRKEEKEKKSPGEGGFPQGWTHFAGCAAGHSCQVQLKADLRVSLSIFSCT